MSTQTETAKETSTSDNGAKPKPPARKLIPLEKLKPNADQARQTWDTSKDEDGKSALDRLAESIRQNGLLNDLIVTPEGDHYLIVCGERRYRAIRNHKLMAEVPCIVRDGLTIAQQLELNIVENLQREDLTPIDEANAYKALMEKCGYTQANLAKRLAISPAMISYRLSLLDLSPGLQKDIAKGRLSETDGRTIAQAVKRIEGPQANQKRQEALSTIEKELKVATTNPKTGKVETPDVKRVAQATVTKVAGAAALPRARAPRNVAPPSTPAANAKVSAKVKEESDHFMQVLKDLNELLRPTRRTLGDGTLRRAVIAHLLIQHPDLPHKVRAALSPLDLIYDEAVKALNAKAQARAEAKAETKPAKSGKKPQAKSQKKAGKKAHRRK